MRQNYMIEFLVEMVRHNLKRGDAIMSDSVIGAQQRQYKCTDNINLKIFR